MSNVQLEKCSDHENSPPKIFSQFCELKEEMSRCPTGYGENDHLEYGEKLTAVTNSKNMNSLDTNLAKYVQELDTENYKT